MRMLPLLLQLVLLPMMVVMCMRRAELTRRLVAQVLLQLPMMMLLRVGRMLGMPRKP